MVHVNVSGQGRINDLNVDQTHVLKRLHKCDQIIKFLSYTKILFFFYVRIKGKVTILMMKVDITCIWNSSAVAARWFINNSFHYFDDTGSFDHSLNMSYHSRM